MFNSNKLQGLVNAAREILERPEASKNDPNSPRMLNETAKREVREAASGYDMSELRDIHEITIKIIEKLKEDGHLPEIFDIARMKKKASSKTEPTVEYWHGSGSRGVTIVWEGVSPVSLHTFIGTSKNKLWQNFTGNNPEEAFKEFLTKYPYGK
jgi:hypothetical protein